jgi:multiple sugar transport system permease protein
MLGKKDIATALARCREVQQDPGREQGEVRGMSTATASAKTSPAQAQANARGRHGKLRLHNPATPYLLCLPYLLLLVTFVLVPAVFGIWISLHDWDFMLPQKPFIGLQNYKDLFDPSQ